MGMLGGDIETTGKKKKEKPKNAAEKVAWQLPGIGTEVSDVTPSHATVGSLLQSRVSGGFGREVSFGTNEVSYRNGPAPHSVALSLAGAGQIFSTEGAEGDGTNRTRTLPVYLYL